jgi:hypothetical protein
LGSFKIGLRKKAKQGNLNIQAYLKYGKEEQGIKGPKQKKLKPKDEVARTKPSDLGF